METPPAYIANSPLAGKAGEPLRRCCTCGQLRRAGEFHFKNRATGERQPYCRQCKSEYNRRWYEARRSQHKKAVIEGRRRRRLAGAAYAQAEKDRPCTDCEGRFPTAAMDFDHVEGKKEAAVSMLVNYGASLKRIKAEIAKCEVVCANCHRVRTAARGYRKEPPS